jgi:hypothetical protein
MTEESELVEQLQAWIGLLEALLREVPRVWLRCRREDSFVVKGPGSASFEFVKLVYKIEKTVPSSEQ